jgi:hypothetical protein
MLGRSLGMKSGVVSSLLSIAAPIVMGALGREKNARGLGAAGLASLLTGQKSSFAQMVPAGLGSVMNWTESGGAEQRFSETARYQPERAAAGATRERGSDWWLLPTLGLAAIALLIYFFWPRGAIVPEEAVTERQTGAETAGAPRNVPTVQEPSPQNTDMPVAQQPAPVRRDSEPSQGGPDAFSSRSEKERVTAETSAPLSRSSMAGNLVREQDLRRVQQALKDQGQDPGPIDGVMGPRTREAVRQFQKANGLQATGTLDQTTMKKHVDNP